MILTGLSFSITLYSFGLIGYMLDDVPLQQMALLTALGSIPSQTSITLILVASIATGIVEETAFRGYMQNIIQKRNHPFIAIAIVALAFTAAHALPLPLWPLFFIGSLGWGFLAYYSNSTLPGIIYHAIIDTASLTWAMYNLDTFKVILSYNVFTDGINPSFKILIVTSIFLAAITILCFSKLRSYRLYNQVQA